MNLLRSRGSSGNKTSSSGQTESPSVGVAKNGKASKAAKDAGRPRAFHPGQKSPQWDSRLHVMTPKEQEERRRKAGLCPTCGTVQTHQLRVLKMRPQTIEGLVYNGICLRCNTIMDARIKLGEIPDANDIRNVSLGRTPSSTRPKPDAKLRRKPSNVADASLDGSNTSPPHQPGHQSSGHLSAGQPSPGHAQPAPPAAGHTPGHPAGHAAAQQRRASGRAAGGQSPVPKVVEGRGLVRDVSEISLDFSVLSLSSANNAPAMENIAEEDPNHRSATFDPEPLPQVGASHVNGGSAMDRLEARIREKNKAADRIKTRRADENLPSSANLAANSAHSAHSAHSSSSANAAPSSQPTHVRSPTFPMAHAPHHFRTSSNIEGPSAAPPSADAAPPPAAPAAPGALPVASGTAMDQLEARIRRKNQMDAETQPAAQSPPPAAPQNPPQSSALGAAALDARYQTLYERKMANAKIAPDPNSDSRPPKHANPTTPPTSTPGTVTPVGAVPMEGPTSVHKTGDATLYNRKLAGETLTASRLHSDQNYTNNAASPPPPYLKKNSNTHLKTSNALISDGEARTLILKNSKNKNYADILDFLKDHTASPSITVLALEKLRDGLPMAHASFNAKANKPISTLDGSPSSPRSTLRNGSWVKILSIIMSTHSTNEVVQLESIRTIWAIASLAPRHTSEFISNTDAMECISKAMSTHNESESVQECGAGLIASLAASMRHAVTLSDGRSGNIVQRLVEALSLHSRKGGVQEQSLKALFRLSSAALANNSDLFAKKMGRYCRSGSSPNATINAINAILDQMQNYSTNLGVQIWACRLLWNVLSPNASSGENDALALFVGTAIKYIGTVMKNNTNNVPFHEAVICLFSKISCYGGVWPSEIDSFARFLVQIMSAHSESWIVALHGCRCIYNLCAVGPTASQSRSVIAKSGGINAILTCMRIFVDHLPIQGEACGALAAVCINSKVNKLTVVEAAGIERLYFAFDSYAASPYDDRSLSTKIRACTAFLVLGVEPKCMEEIRRAGILLKFKEITTNESADDMPLTLWEVIQELLMLDSSEGDELSAMQFVEGANEDETELCLSSNLSAIIKPDGSSYITPSLRLNIIRSMKTFPNCTSIQELGCKVLACIYNLLNARTSPSLDEVQELETITKCLRENKGSPDVVKAACSAIKNYCMTRSSNAPNAPRGLSDTLSRSLVEVVNAMGMCRGVSQAIEQATGALWALCIAKEGLQLNNAINNIIEAMERFKNSFELQKNCIGVLWSFFSSPVNVQNWVTNECVSCILRFIEDFENEENAVDIAVNTLMILTNRGYQPILVLLNNEIFIDSVVGGMFKYPNNTSIQAASCYILSNIALDNYLRNDISSRGGTGRVVFALGDHSNDHYVVCKAIVALANLIGGADVEILRGSQTTQNLLAAMQAHQNDVFVQVKGAATLWNLSARHDSFKDEIVQQGGARIISEAMTQFISSKEMQEKGFIALWSLSVPRNLKAEVGIPSLVPIVNGMAAHISEENQKLVEEGLGVLKCLSVEPRNKVLLEDLNVVDLIFSCMWIHSECASVQQAALAALSNVSVNVITNQVSQIDKDDLEAIINAMRSHSDSKGVQESAIILLRNYTFSPSNCLVLQENMHLVPLIRTATMRFSDSFEGRVEHLLNVLPGYMQ